MTNAVIEAKAREYREYKRIAEEMQALADSIADELKAATLENGKAEETKAGRKITLIVGEYKLSLSDNTRKDIDKKRLEAEYSDIYNSLLKEIAYKRFTVA